MRKFLGAVKSVMKSTKKLLNKPNQFPIPTNSISTQQVQRSKTLLFCCVENVISILIASMECNQQNVVINDNEHTYAEHKLLNKLIIFLYPIKKQKMQIITPCISGSVHVTSTKWFYTKTFFASRYVLN